jgi:hypothetical protein
MATAVCQVGVLRAAGWASRGLRTPARNALLADSVPGSVYGRAYGFERAMDNLGAILGPLLAIAFVSVLSVRTAILLSVIPGLLAVAAMAYAIAHISRNEAVLAWAFVLAGIGIGLVETAEHAAVARAASPDVRGSAFGLLAGTQSFGNLEQHRARAVDARVPDVGVRLLGRVDGRRVGSGVGRQQNRLGNLARASLQRRRLTRSDRSSRHNCTFPASRGRCPVVHGCSARRSATTRCCIGDERARMAEPDSVGPKNVKAVFVLQQSKWDRPCLWSRNKCVLQIQYHPCWIMVCSIAS